MSCTGDSDLDTDYFPSSPSSSSSDSSFDEEEVNCRISPHWHDYQDVLKHRGYRLDTVQDVKAYYDRCELTRIPEPFASAENIKDFTALCPDAGLPDNLFRGTRCCDGTKIIVKAVHRRSHELAVIRYLSSPPLRDHPMNHCIPVLDIIEICEEDLAFIVMEQWSSQLIADDGVCCLALFLAAVRQCIEHVVFMHEHGVVHLDISLRNLLTDYQGRYAYIDYERSRRFDGINSPPIYNFKATEVPPECEDGECFHPYQVDIWALAVIILRACKLTGYCIPELIQFVRPMLHEDPYQRPTARYVLEAYDRMVLTVLRPDASCPTLEFPPEPLP